MRAPTKSDAVGTTVRSLMRCWINWEWSPNNIVRENLSTKPFYLPCTKLSAAYANQEFLEVHTLIRFVGCFWIDLAESHTFADYATETLRRNHGQEAGWSRCSSFRSGTLFVCNFQSSAYHLRQPIMSQCYLDIAKLIDPNEVEKPSHLEILVFQLRYIAIVLLKLT